MMGSLRRVVVLSGFALSAPAAIQFVSAQQPRKPLPIMGRVELAEGISVSIPRDWVIEDAQSNRRRFTEGAAPLRLAHVPGGEGGVLLTASPDGSTGRVSVVVSVMHRKVAEQADVAGLQGSRLDAVHRQFREDLEAVMRVEHATLFDWLGSSKVRIGPLYSLVSRYTYAMPGGPRIAIESHRIFLGGGSVGFMLQTPVGEEQRYRQTFDAVRGSLRASMIP